jgi:tRNA U34 5-methylaminomethyl-2-thiouridine-forming methyltransferase MnmC
MELKVITTSDGSHSLLNTRLQETYHSVHGAVQETMHVFIAHGLDYFIRKNQASALRLLEVGFGTGLNALLTVRYALSSPVDFQYTSLEAFPIPEDTVQALNYPEIVEMPGVRSVFNRLHSSRWNEEEEILPNFKLHKIQSTLQNANLAEQQFDLVYFDAFAPSKQPELWELGILAKVAATMKDGAVFVTYCAKGQLKRDLKSLGLTVETLPGPPGKKEMVRAEK